MSHSLGRSPSQHGGYEGRRLDVSRRPKHKINSISIGVGTPRPKHTPERVKGPHMTFQLRDNQEVILTVVALDSEGNPAAASTAWASSDESVASVTDNGDGTAKVTASPGAEGLGTATITASVTDNSDGDVHDGTFEVEVVAGDAVVVNVTAGEPTDKAPVEPPIE